MDPAQPVSPYLMQLEMQQCLVNWIQREYSIGWMTAVGTLSGYQSLHFITCFIGKEDKVVFGILELQPVPDSV